MLLLGLLDVQPCCLHSQVGSHVGLCSGFNLAGRFVQLHGLMDQLSDYW